ncbi:putative leucine-rich repeat receptor-like serine/threonine-protein kinase [Cucumis melo var. makuwa]|uniref:Leucine-rich repeat receptor-like serine/threonine-protein kinase n=1 Tax=Cucumis melo var. makuwa TaxID=1194695 RepID=A0A5A7VH47_CUCMM|nr:putative leucine-rich repeat receptor-like serine/threonine-protein kinase [Cucumis melo var. makuwa]TYK00868.1 putative leucine-rich repeat receptor-like serine/threonine-protein kinase [Cucumis melo var. makuwa]
MREHSMLPKGDMVRYTKSIGKRILTTKTFMFCVTAKKATEAGTRFKFSMFMRMEKNKTCTTKNYMDKRQKEEGRGLSLGCDDVYAQHVYFVERCRDMSVEQECAVGREKKEEWSLYTPRNYRCEEF